MSQSTYTSVVLASRPKALIVPGETFNIKENPMVSEKDLQDGQIMIQTLYLSLDPAMRGWLNDTRSYIPPVQIGEVMRGAVIGKVIASKSSKFTLGNYVTASPGWSELAIVAEKDASVLDVPDNGKVTDALGVLGMTGLTAYFGITDIGKVKAGDFVVVSGAAGATGSVACQIAKLLGAKVLGLAGSDDKVQWLKDLGCDEALNYKNADFAKEFKEKTKDLIDVFFDNVGGEILELALSRAKAHARFVMCGAISQYNSAKPVGPKNISMVIAMRIKLEGFIVFDYQSQYGPARTELSRWLSEGKIQRKETIIKGGLKAAEQALLDLYNGINTGKLLVEVKAEDAEGAVGSRL
ncbi:probable zinc-binding alcohol dehydrogenase domain-containing protein 1 [Rhynchosporium graminicola]|uniref:Probable zinc-binding alcohol dehydrogenase domain-containing protein 1 n=1 Tax=Rhynchosporium graminicola TaxID=2792576 RepID=A0A1E1LT32_9HELO|nr:probable zinc-binding alcohol dehydrogenase domain-containing protein 1 [Rhynchosporium commune]